MAMYRDNYPNNPRKRTEEFGEILTTDAIKHILSETPKDPKSNLKKLVPKLNIYCGSLLRTKYEIRPEIESSCLFDNLLRCLYCS